MGFWVFLYQLICLVGNNCSLDKYASVAASPPLAFKLYANIGRNYFFIVLLSSCLLGRGTISDEVQNHPCWLTYCVWPVGKHMVLAPALLYALVLACRRHVLR